jgi:hypothetical protein
MEYWGCAISVGRLAHAPAIRRRTSLAESRRLSQAPYRLQSSWTSKITTASGRFHSAPDSAPSAARTQPRGSTWPELPAQAGDLFGNNASSSEESPLDQDGPATWPTETPCGLPSFGRGYARFFNKRQFCGTGKAVRIGYSRAAVSNHELPSPTVNSRSYDQSQSGTHPGEGGREAGVNSTPGIRSPNIRPKNRTI